MYHTTRASFSHIIYLQGFIPSPSHFLLLARQVSQVRFMLLVAFLSVIFLVVQATALSVSVAAGAALFGRLDVCGLTCR